MIPFITEQINNPWTEKELKEHKGNDSILDKVIFNSRYNARITLSEKNTYLCSIKNKDSEYVNFYLYAVTRNCFYFVFFDFQMHTLKRAIEKYNGLLQFAEKLPLTSKLLSSIDSNIKLSETVIIDDGDVILIKVNAPIEDFLVPRRGIIKNQEIQSKYALMKMLYKQTEREMNCLFDMLDSYSNAIDEKRKQMRKAIMKKLGRVAIRKTARVVLFGCVLGGISLFADALFDLDDLTDLDTIMDVSDMGEGLSDLSDMTFSSVDIDGLSFDNIDLNEFCDSELIASNDISFGSNDFSFYDDRIKSAQDDFCRNIEKATDENTHARDIDFHVNQAQKARMNEDYWKKAREDAEYWKKMEEIDKYRREAPLEIAQKAYEETARIFGYDIKTNTWIK